MKRASVLYLDAGFSVLAGLCLGFASGLLGFSPDSPAYISAARLMFGGKGFTPWVLTETPRLLIGRLFFRRCSLRSGRCSAIW